MKLLFGELDLQKHNLFIEVFCQAGLKIKADVYDTRNTVSNNHANIPATFIYLCTCMVT